MKTYTLYVYDPVSSSAPKVDGTALTATEAGTNVTWWKYTISAATLPSSITLTMSDNGVPLAITPVDGATDYYYMPYYGTRQWTATTASYDPPKDIYIAGSFNSWNLTKMDSSDGTTYSFNSIAFGNDAITSNRVVFGNGNSWDDAYRPTTDGTVIPVNTDVTATVVAGSSINSWSVPKGTYNITFNKSTGIFRFDGTPAVVPFYLHASNGSGTWSTLDTGAGTFTTTNGVDYTLSNVSLDKDAYFLFSTAVGDWTAINASRFNTSASSDETITSGTEYTAVSGNGSSKSYRIPTAGTWDFTYNIATNKWTGTLVSATVDMYLLGGVSGNDWSTGTQMTTSDNNVYTLTGQTLLQDSYLRFRDNENVHYAPATDGTTLVAGTAGSLTLYPSGTNNSFKITADGVYTITVNRTAKTVTLTKTADVTRNTYTVHVIDNSSASAAAPYVHAWGTGVSSEFPGPQLSTTETINGETWYKTTFTSTDATLNVIASAGNSSHQTNTINITPGDWYIVFNGSQNSEITPSHSAATAPASYVLPPVTMHLLNNFSTENWTTGDQMTSSDNNVYSYTVNVPYVDGGKYYRFRDSEGNQYYPATTGTELTLGTAATMEKGASADDKAYKITTGGNYTFTVNRSAKTVTVTKNGTQSTFNIHVIDTQGNVPFVYVWDKYDNKLTGAFPGTASITTETINGETWYKTTVSAESLINVIVSNNGTNQTADVTGWTDSDLYISYASDRTEQANRVAYQGATAPTTAQQVPKTYTVYVKANNAPYLYAWDTNETATNGAWHGTQMSTTEVLADGNTWYKYQVSTPASQINFLLNDGDSQQSDDIVQTDLTAYYIYNGSTTVTKVNMNTYTLYARATDGSALHAYIYGNPGEVNGIWETAMAASLATETLADGNAWYKYSFSTTAEGYNAIVAKSSSDQSVDITGITESVTYIYYLTDEDKVENKTQVYRTTVAPVNRNTGEMYIIGQVDGQNWASNAGRKMTKTGEYTYKVENVQLIENAQIAFASKLGVEGDWTLLNSYRYSSEATGQNFEVTEAMTEKGNPTALGLKPWRGEDKNFKIMSTGYYDITVNTQSNTVTIERPFNTLYMYYPNHWDVNDGEIMTTKDGVTYTLTGVELDANDSFQFTTKLGSDWNSISDYRLSANVNADEENMEITAANIGKTLSNALIQGGDTHKDFKMANDAELKGKYRVVVNITDMSVALYNMATVLDGQTIILLEQTSNVTNPKIWAYDKETLQANGDRIHVDRPSRSTIYDNRKKLLVGLGADVAEKVTTADGRKWWKWTATNSSIADFWFTRGDYDYKGTDETDEDMTVIEWRKSGELYFSWAADNTLEEHTRDYYEAAAQEIADCAALIEGHYYVYFTNTPGWDHVFCHAWYSDVNGVNHDMCRLPAPNQDTKTYPGSLCELVGYDKDGYEVWRFDFGTVEEMLADNNGYYPSGILFNNGVDDRTLEGELRHWDYSTNDYSNVEKEQSGDAPAKNGGNYDYCGMISLGRTLGVIIKNGVVEGPPYTLADDVEAVWFDANATTTVSDGTTDHTVYGALYVKDLNKFTSTNYVERSLQKEGEIDYVLNRTNLMEGKNRYDQSNWVKLTLSSLYENNAGEKLSDHFDDKAWQLAQLSGLEGKVLKAKDESANIMTGVTGQLVNNINPEIHITEQPTVETPSTAYSTSPNVYVTANFLGGTQTCTESVDVYGHDIRNTYFFVTPKPQEYATVTWAVYDAANQAFTVPKRSDSQNKGGLNGYFPVDWTKNGGSQSAAPTGQPVGMVDGQAYGPFQVLIVLDENKVNGSSNSGSGAPRRAPGDAAETNYLVYPLNLTADLVTAIHDMNVGGKTVADVRYINMTGVESDRPFEGVNIVVTTYSDGTRSTTKMINR